MKRIYPNHLPERAPKYIIAFRGTIPKPRSTLRRNLKLNIKVLIDELHMDKSRFKHALETVEKVVQEAGSANIWLARHSLGSAIAMLIGKSMSQKGKHLETFLFNPPFLRPSLSKIINNPYLEHRIRSTKIVIKAAISFVGGDHMWQERYRQFNALSSWIPNLFVNQDDPICSGYIYHFRNRKTKAEIGSIRSALKAALGKDPQLPIHLFPKAYLTISKNSSSRNICKICEARGLKQWWYQMSIGPGFADSSTNVSIGDPIRVGEQHTTSIDGTIGHFPSIVLPLVLGMYTLLENVSNS
ncbi:GDSL esterase/lipase [Vitis vinifera]|nr:GDSL esterase/lipase [Vitis vinifera]RVW60899.1 GDSL esterase/lipase [Vitis vinifera]